MPEVLNAHTAYDPLAVASEKPGPCEWSTEFEDSDGYARFRTCPEPGSIEVEGELLCEDHAGQLGAGPRQEHYGYDPDDGHAHG